MTGSGKRGNDGTAAGPASVQFIEMVFPAQANHYGTLFAGNGLALMAKAAMAAATRRAGKDVVMAAVDRISFDSPVRVGEILELSAQVIRVGRSSMTVRVSGMAQAPAGGVRRPTMEGQFEMVAVNPDGRPSPIEDDADGI